MTAAFVLAQTENNELLHAVRVVEQRGMIKVKAVAYCGATGDAGDGVHQVPMWAFDGRPTYPYLELEKMVAGTPAPPMKVCDGCVRMLAAIAKAPS